MKTITNNLFRYAITIICIFAFLAANTIKIPYTPYQILVWELKANEGYRSWWYPDGGGHSIGFGWNDLGGKRRKEIAKYTKDGKVTYNEATEIMVKELEKYGTLHKDPYRNLALQLYSYNCGLTKSGSSLGHCCGASKGCGNRNSDIRKSHNRRRKFEMALWKHDYANIIAHCEKNRDKAVQMEIRYK